MEYRSTAIRINGHPTQVEYTYHGALPFHQAGKGAGDCEPEEPAEVEIDAILDDRGHCIMQWLSESQLESIEEQLLYG